MVLFFGVILFLGWSYFSGGFIMFISWVVLFLRSYFWGSHISGVVLFLGWPYFRGSGVAIFLGWSYFWGGLVSRVVLFFLGWPYFRGGLISGRYQVCQGGVSL